MTADTGGFESLDHADAAKAARLAQEVVHLVQADLSKSPLERRDDVYDPSRHRLERLGAELHVLGGRNLQQQVIDEVHRISTGWSSALSMMWMGRGTNIADRLP